ncbi:MAG: hypothetical protein ACREOO_16260 [bacterium]
MTTHHCKVACALFLIAAFTFSNCASTVYTLTQLQGDERLQSDLRGKRVEVLRKDDRMTTGYFQAITVDTLTLYRKQNERAALHVPAYDVRTIRVLASQKTEVVVVALILGACVALFVYAQAYGDAFSGLE